MVKYNISFNTNENITQDTLEILLNNLNNLNITSFQKIDTYDNELFLYKKYGKGYLLFVNNKSELYGKKYFLNGIWLPKVKGWFFKNINNLLSLNILSIPKNKTYEDMFPKEFNFNQFEYSKELNINNSDLDNNSDDDINYIFHTDKNMDDTDSSDDDYLSNNIKKITMDHHNRKIEYYGKGLLLYPSENDKYYNKKYLDNGWWIDKHKAWFFKKEYLNGLINNGAIFLSKKNE